MNTLKLGWTGLGNMGNPMVMNLLKAGFEVTVFNRTKDKESPLLAAGAKSASSLQELMETCDIVLTMLSNDAAVKEVFEGPTGLLSKTNSHWRSFATSANFNLEHNRSVCNAITLSLRINSQKE